ncbi:PREDICTED: uncharacterized protein LOC106809061 [Priapulus caudatus]|uniref:Uncharacterized protein LOC106809061 n=1 Tax=Priapulus caudatus TaxID=37621 RepID=A0ABM1E5M0_PRICU|nr:PREDICTED: uncharacterized protein LOC106809061 [Priapulus caudatus]
MTFYVRVSVCIFVFFAACVLPMIRGEDMHKYVGVARCRAECVDKLIPESNIGDEACMNDQSCFMCWETCSMLYMDYQVWGMMCKVPELCYEGCQVSCRFSRRARASRRNICRHRTSTNSQFRWRTPILS